MDFFVSSTTITAVLLQYLSNAKEYISAQWLSDDPFDEEGFNKQLY